MSAQDSRPPSTVLDIEDDPSLNGGDRKANTDSGFHDEEYSTPTPSTSGGKRHYHHTRRRATPPPDDDDDDDEDGEVDAAGKQIKHPRHPSHDSLLSRFSDLQDYNSINFDYGSNTSESSVVSAESVGSNSKVNQQQQQEPPPPQQGNYIRKLGKKQAPQPLTPPPTSCGLDGTATTKEYEFPSDTELSEIIAIMSGIASPRKQNGKVFHSKSHLNPHPEVHGDEDILTLDDPPPPPSRTLSQPRLRRGESLNFYEKKSTPSSMNGSAVVGMSNGNIPNGTLNRRFLPKQGKSLDAVSVAGSEKGGGLNDLNKSKNQSMNSLNSILMASKAGTLPNMPKKKKKVKKKAPSPRKKDDGEDPGEEEYKNKLSWKQRLKLSLTIIVSVLLILSGSSLLFIVPIIVDPILVGLEARFSLAPAQCRTVNKRNGSGSSDCSTPSCREGCTADLMFCYFIDVEYHIGVYNTSAKSLHDNNKNIYLTYNHSDDVQLKNPEDHASSSLSKQNVPLHSKSLLVNPKIQYLEADSTQVESKPQGGILLINPSGCGYPPEINCLEFEKKFGAINYTFPCYYSRQNESIVVPFYSRSLEMLILSISLIIPCGSCIILTGFLYLLLKWKPNPYQKRKKKKEKQEDPPVDNSDPKLRKDQNGIHEDGLRLNNGTSNGKIPKANSALSNIMGDLTGITAKNVMKTKNYTKFHSSLSNPNSAMNSRQGSVTRESSQELELVKVEESKAGEKISNKTLSSSTSSIINKGREGSSSGSVALNNDNYNFNHVKSSSKYNEKDFASGQLLSNGHVILKDLSPPDTNDQDHLLPNPSSASSAWRLENNTPADVSSRIETRKGSEEVIIKASSRASSNLRTPQMSSMSTTSKIIRNNRNSIDSIDSLESVKTLSFSKL